MRSIIHYRFIFAMLALAGSLVISPAQAIDDVGANELLERVKSVLADKQADVAKDISVSFEDGAIVLDGTAPSQEAIDAVVLTIGKVDGVKTIVNNLSRKE